jgi:hypothetical protein
VTTLSSSRSGRRSVTDTASRYDITEEQLASAEEPSYSIFDQFASESGEELIRTTVITDYGYRIVLNSTGQRDIYYAIIGAYTHFVRKFDRVPQDEGEVHPS